MFETQLLPPTCQFPKAMATLVLPPGATVTLALEAVLRPDRLGTKCRGAVLPRCARLVSGSFIVVTVVRQPSVFAIGVIGAIHNLAGEETRTAGSECGGRCGRGGCGDAGGSGGVAGGGDGSDKESGTGGSEDKQDKNLVVSINDGAMEREQVKQEPSTMLLVPTCS